MEERIEQLKLQEKQLQMQLDEIRFLIQGYKNAMENQQDDVPEQVEEVWPKQKEKAKRPERKNGYA